MIKKINSIREIGIYKSFDWPADLPDFGDLNLIYGWNYSGKTTLSRVFGVLEKPETLSGLGGRFSVEDDNGHTIDSQNIDQPLNCRVFNRNFIERNFQEEHNAPAVFIVGDEANKLRKRIDRLKKHEERVERVKNRFRNEKREWERRVNDGLKRDGARAIAELVSERNFNRSGLDQILREIGSSVEEHVLSADEFDALKATASSSESFTEMRAVKVPEIQVEEVIGRVKELIAQTASNRAIQKLKDNPELESWVREGREIHKGEDYCGFCGEELTQDRVLLLQGHFSTEYESLVQRLKAEIASIKNIDLSTQLPRQVELIHSVRDQYEDLIQPLPGYITAVKEVFDELLDCLNDKLTKIESGLVLPDSAFEKIDLLPEFSYELFSASITALFDEHNQKISDMEATRGDAKDLIKRHSAATFYIENNIEGEENDLERVNNKLSLARNLSSAIAERIEDKEDQIKQYSVAVGRLNDLIGIILSGSNVSAIQLSESEFEFRRGNQKAKNLSEGERTAIAFCYFLLTLEDSGNSIENTIVFVDDPISSLDSNHIYSVYALIMERLRERCKQLFISTHNSEFFNLLKDECLKGGANRNFKAGCQGYYTQRSCDMDGQPFSQLICLPDSLRKFKSEYQFVFSMLYEFANNQMPTLHEAYTAPVLLRKLLEAYLGFRRPGGGGWSGKLGILIDDEVDRREIDKFTNDASHLQGANRVVQHADYIASAKALVSKVLQALEAKDGDHYLSLVDVVS